MYTKINELYNSFVENNSFPYMEIQKDDGFYTEISFEEKVEELFVENGIKTSDITVNTVFNSPGLDVVVTSIAWIENGKLETFFETFDRC